MRFFFCVVGLVLIVEGLPYFTFPGKMKKWIASILEIPDSHLRIMGMFAMGLGLLIAYFAKE